MDRVGRQAHRLRRPGPPLRRQVLYRQLPARFGRQSGAQQAPRHRTLRQDGGRARASRGPQAARHGRSRRGPGGRSRQEPPHAAPRAGLRGVHEGQSQAEGEHQRELPRPLRAASRGLARPSSRRHHAQRRGGPFQPHHREARLGDRESVHVPAALGLSPALRGPRGIGQSRRSLARGRRQVSSQAAPQDPAAGRGAAMLAEGYRGGCHQSRPSGCVLVRHVHGHAARRGDASPLGSCRQGGRGLPRGRDQDRCAARASRHPAAWRPYSIAGGPRAVI